MYRIVEAFGPTMQGEGSHAGRVVDFLRFSGCNRSCHFCDTKWDEVVFSTTSPHTVLEYLPRSAHRRLVITGGEPLLQLDANLLSVLREHYTDIHVETNGSIDPNSEVYKSIDHISCSPKQLASSSKLTVVHDLKVIWPTEFDTIENYVEKWPNANLFIQPIHSTTGSVENIQLLIEELTSKWPLAKISLQQHKFIGVM